MPTLRQLILQPRILQPRILQWFLLLTLLPAFLSPTSVFAAQRQSNGLPIAQQASVQQANLQQAFQPSVLMRIRERGNVMVVGVPYDFPPFSYVGEDGKLTGFDVELLRAVGADWGVQVEFVSALAADVTTLLSGGSVDIAPVVWPSFDLHKLAESPRNIDFSQPYLTDQWCLLSAEGITASEGTIPNSGTGERSSGNNSERSSGNSSVGYIDGVGQVDFIDDWLSTIPEFSASTDAGRMPFRENGPALAALQALQIQSYLTFDKHCWALDNSSERFGFSTGSYTQRTIAKSEARFVWGLADTLPTTRNLLNYTLQKLVRSGDYARIHQQWFPAHELPALLLHPGTWTETFSSITASPTISEFTDASEFPHYSELGTIRIGVPSDLPPFGLQIASAPISELSLDSTVDSVLERSGLAGFDVDVAVTIIERLRSRHENATAANAPTSAQESNDAGATINEPSVNGPPFSGTSDGAALTIELVPIIPQTGSRLLAQGALDMVVSAVSPKWPDMVQLGFSEPYLFDSASLLVGADSESVFQAGGSADSDSFQSAAVETIMSGTIAYVVGDLAAELWLAQVGGVPSLGPAMDEPIDTLALPYTFPFQEFSAALRSLEAGQADGLIGATELLQYAANQNDSLQITATIEATVAYSVLVNTARTPLRRSIDSILLEMVQDGTLAVLYEKWFVNNALASTDPTQLLARSRFLPSSNDGTLTEPRDESSGSPGPSSPGIQKPVPHEAGPSASPNSVIKPRSSTVTPKEDPSSKNADARLTVGDLMNLSSSTQITSPDVTSPEITSTGAASVVAQTPEATSPLLDSLSEEDNPVRNSAVDTVGDTVDASSGATSGGSTSDSRGIAKTVDNFDTYIVGEGETLISLAVEFYGDQSQWQLLYEANLEAVGGNPSFVELGTELFIPRLGR